MAGRTSSVRAEAVRRARDAKAARDSERLRVEGLIETAMADFFESRARAEQIRAEARVKAEKLIEAAESAAASPEQDAADAVRRLRALGQTNGDIAELCGIKVGEIRTMTATSSGDRSDSSVVQAA
jgi:DNA-directed RNA polymerase specialized sigma24 family protein